MARLPTASPTPPADPTRINMLARQLVIAQGLNMIQQINSQSFTATGSGTVEGTVVNVTPRNVGLLKNFFVEVTGSIKNNNASAALTLTPFNLANILSGIVFTDLNNNVRIQTTGWHMNFVNTATQNRNYAAANQIISGDNPIQYGNVFGPISISTSSIAAGATATFKMFYRIPIAYSDTDLRGAIFMNVTNNTAQLQFTVNPNIGVTSAADPTLAVVKGEEDSSTHVATLTALTINTYQNYLDQLPQGQNGYVLPQIDLSTLYQIQNTNNTSLTANQDIPTQYANYRQFLSTIAIFDNAGVLSTGSDVAYWAIQSANFTNIFKVDPTIVSVWARQRIGQDFPVGVYYFDHRVRPVSTIQYGNMELILNASSVTAGAFLLLGYESFAIQNLITNAGSLPGGG